MILLHIPGEIRDKLNKRMRSCELRECLHKNPCVSVQVSDETISSQLCVADTETAKAPGSAGLPMSLGGGRRWQEAGEQEGGGKQGISPPLPTLLSTGWMDATFISWLQSPLDRPPWSQCPLGSPAQLTL